MENFYFFRRWLGWYIIPLLLSFRDFSLSVYLPYLRRPDRRFMVGLLQAFLFHLTSIVWQTHLAMLVKKDSTICRLSWQHTVPSRGCNIKFLKLVLNISFCQTEHIYQFMQNSYINIRFYRLKFSILFSTNYIFEFEAHIVRC